MGCSKCRSKRQYTFNPPVVHATIAHNPLLTAHIQFRQDVVLSVDRVNTLYRASTTAYLPFDVVRAVLAVNPDYLIFLDSKDEVAYRDYIRSSE